MFLNSTGVSPSLELCRRLKWQIVLMKSNMSLLACSRAVKPAQCSSRTSLAADVLISVVLLSAGLQRTHSDSLAAVLTVFSGLLLFTLVEYCFHIHSTTFLPSTQPALGRQASHPPPPSGQELWGHHAAVGYHPGYPACVESGAKVNLEGVAGGQLPENPDR